MRRSVSCLILVMLLGCGYRVVPWAPQRFSTIEIASVSASPRHADMALRLRDALIQGCLSFSGLQPVTSGPADLTLYPRILDYREQTLATDVDGRTKRVQFSIRAAFVLKDRNGKLLWSLPNYAYSEQYEISTTTSGFRNEAVYTQDASFVAVADLVITSFTQALSKVDPDEQRGDSSR